MSYLNIHNLCQFEGRMIADAEISQINTQKGPITKAKFTLAVDRMMDKNAKTAAVAAGNPTADFPRFEVIGPKADFVAKWLGKGKPCTVVGSFKTFTFVDKNQVKQFGWNFDVVDVTFTLSDNSNGTGGANTGGNNAGGTQQYNAPADNNTFAAIPDGDMPF